MASTIKQKCRNGISKLKDTVSFVWTDITTLEQARSGQLRPL